MQNNPFNMYAGEYEDWFRENPVIFQSELEAIKKVMPAEGEGVEVGIGTGVFAEPLGIRYGIDPAQKMLDYARNRGLVVEKAVAENLPYTDHYFDYVVFITSLCFIGDPKKALAEARRVLKPGGIVIVAFIDRNSALGKTLETGKEESPFYRHARFFSTPEILLLLEESGFTMTDVYQTLIKMDSKTPEQPERGYGKGGFVVIRAE